MCFGEPPPAVEIIAMKHHQRMTLKVCLGKREGDMVWSNHSCEYHHISEDRCAWNRRTVWLLNIWCRSKRKLCLELRSRSSSRRKGRRGGTSGPGGHVPVYGEGRRSRRFKWTDQPQRFYSRLSAVTLYAAGDLHSELFFFNLRQLGIEVPHGVCRLSAYSRSPGDWSGV